ncbi:MAG: uncharacterized protein KVP18_001319 [Porospora cf. gigantea A]|uniref:uncharacterized protein n=1 Tax=Porospora cf. gigantea A TaxID=2853593 RepID=UPI003559BAA2|nr:MAG: hypothetical protein KVP18_001319 [Porospora cf. gigantea A]
MVSALTFTLRLEGNLSSTVSGYIFQHNDKYYSQTATFLEGVSREGTRPAVLSLEPVLRKSLYGFNSMPNRFVRVAVSHPSLVRVLASALAEQLGIPVFHAHIPFFLASLVETGIRMCDWVFCSGAFFASPVTRAPPVRVLTRPAFLDPSTNHVIDTHHLRESSHDPRLARGLFRLHLRRNAYRREDVPLNTVTWTSTCAPARY